eukprot:GSMAST32.ASY1.ANO1.936.1 assembled CDS
MILKRSIDCKVTSVEVVPCKKRGNKVIVVGKDLATGAEVRDVKPEGREIYKVGSKKADKKKRVQVVKKASTEDYDMSVGSAGAAKTVPIRAGEVKKGSYLVMKGHPCKHGHAKANINGLDVFTGKKYNEISPTSHNMTAPTMYRSEWQLTDVSHEGNMTLMSENGTTREDLDLPRDTSGNLSDLANQITEKFANCPDGKGVYCVVLKAMDNEQVVDIIVKDAN